MSSLQDSLKGLRDIDGVVGSFVVSTDGTLLGSDLPGVFDVESLTEAAPRLARLFEAINSHGGDLAHCVLRYTEHLLWLHPFEEGNVLCIIAPSAANLASLRMGARLVARRLPRLIRDPFASISSSNPVLDVPDLPAPDSGSSSGTMRASPVPGAPKPRGRRLFRGRPVD